MNTNESKERIMHRLGVLIGLLLACACYLNAQNRLRFVVDKEGKLYAIPTETSYEIKIPEVTYKSYIPITELSRQLSERYTDIYRKYAEVSESGPEFYFLPANEADRPMNMNTLSAAYRPFFNPYTPMLRRMNPMALDYDEYYFHPIADNSLLMVNGGQETWPGAGGMNEVNLSITHRIGALSITGVAFAGRFYTPFTPNAALYGGFHAMAHYQVTDWMALKAWGSYAYYGKNKADPFLVMNPALNSVNVGGALEFKIGDNAGFGFGVNFQHDPFRGRMRPQYIFYPTHTGTFFDKIGIQVN